VPAASLREARAWGKRLDPDAYVLDVALRGEDTWGLLAELKSDAATRQRPVLLVTRADDEAKAKSLGADGYLSKPFDPELLVRELDRLTQPAGPVPIAQPGGA
jgi:DNA-binding response OmpR family regulator